MGEDADVLSPVRAPGPRISGLRSAALDELEPEPALHAQMTAGDVVVERRGHLHDPVVLHMQLEVAADAAVRADRRGYRLPGLIPVAGLPQLVLAGRHERSGGAYPDAVAAVHAR